MLDVLSNRLSVLGRFRDDVGDLFLPTPVISLHHFYFTLDSGSM